MTEVRCVFAPQPDRRVTTAKATEQELKDGVMHLKLPPLPGDIVEKARVSFGRRNEEKEKGPFGAHS